MPPTAAKVCSAPTTPAEQIRVSWHASDEAPASLVDLRIIPDGAGTRLDLRQSTSTCLPVTTSRPCAPSGRPRSPTWPPRGLTVPVGQPLEDVLAPETGVAEPDEGGRTR